MNNFFTLLVTGLVCFVTNTAKAQFSQNFDLNSTYASNCWTLTGLNPTTTAGEIINGTASLLSEPTTNGTGTRDVLTPYLNITSTTFTVSFKYKLNSALNGQATRSIEVGLMNKNGVFTSLDAISMDRNTLNPTTTKLYDKTFTLATTSIQRLVLRFGGSTGDGNSRMILDDLTANASAYYGPASTCNGAPTAISNTFQALSNTLTYKGTSVLANDTDPNGEALTASLATASPDGTVVMNSDGTFTFTPNVGFTGTFTSFTYSITDNGYSPQSATASVNLYFSQVAALPLRLLHFSGTAIAKTALTWNVADNETGLLFEVQRSSNGNAYQSIATLFTTEKTGDEQYQFADASSNGAASYRLKLVNKDGTFFYSHVVSFQAKTATDKLVLLQNPVQSALRFALPSISATIQSITIYNASGLIVASKKTGLKNSNNTFNMPLVANLPAGTYVLHVSTGTGSKTATFIKQ